MKRVLKILSVTERHTAQRLAYGSMPLELAETSTRSNFPESRNAFCKVRSAKLNTDVKILMPRTDYFGETALKQLRHHIPVNTMRKSHNHTLSLHWLRLT